jgi:hypothetical protein
MRYGLDVVELRTLARHLHDADRAEAAVSILRVGVARIECRDAVDVERVGVDVRLERTHGHAPHAIVVLRQRVRLAVELAGRDDGLRVGREEPQRDLPVRAHFGRDDLRRAAPSTTLPPGLRAR